LHHSSAHCTLGLCRDSLWPVRAFLICECVPCPGCGKYRFKQRMSTHGLWCSVFSSSAWTDNYSLNNATNRRKPKPHVFLRSSYSFSTLLSQYVSRSSSLAPTSCHPLVAMTLLVVLILRRPMHPPLLRTYPPDHVVLTDLIVVRVCILWWDLAHHQNPTNLFLARPVTVESGNVLAAASRSRLCVESGASRTPISVCIAHAQKIDTDLSMPDKAIE